MCRIEVLLKLYYVQKPHTQQNIYNVTRYTNVITMNITNITYFFKSGYRFTAQHCTIVNINA